VVDRENGKTIPAELADMIEVAGYHESTTTCHFVNSEAFEFGEPRRDRTYDQDIKRHLGPPGHGDLNPERSGSGGGGNPVAGSSR